MNGMFLPALAGMMSGDQQYQDAIQARQQRAQQMQFEQMRQQALQAEMARQAQEQARQKDVARGTLALYGQPPAQPPAPGQSSQPMQQGGPQPWQPMNSGMGQQGPQPPQGPPPMPPYRSMSGGPQPTQQAPQIPEPPKYDWNTAVQKIKAQGITDPEAIVATMEKHQARLDVEARQKLAAAKEQLAEQRAAAHEQFEQKSLELRTKAEQRMERNTDSMITKRGRTGGGGAGGAGGGASTGALNSDAIDFAARQVILTGQMPPMGMGKAAAAQRAAVLNRAAELAKTDGQDANDLQANKAEVKAQSASLSQLTKLDGMIGNFEQTATKNVKLALDLAKKGTGGTNYPTLNAWIQAARTGTGSADVIAFRNALTTVKTEYAKIMSGATGAAGITDAARREADTMMNENMSLPQLEAAFNTAVTEMGNRRSSIKEQIDSTRKGIKGVGKKDGGHPPDISDLLNKYGK